MGNKSKYVQFDKSFLKEVEEFGYVLGSFTSDAYIPDCHDDHEVCVYELNKRKYWIRKYNGELMEFRDIT